MSFGTARSSRSSTRTSRSTRERLLRGQRHRKPESRALSQRRFHPDSPPVALHDALANCQSNARSRVVVTVQPLKHAENLLGVFRVDSNAVIFHAKQPIRILAPRADTHLGRIRPAVLDRVANQVLE